MPFATSGNIITSSNQIAPGIIVNTDVSASAAIAYSKLALALSIVDADVSASAAIAYSKLNLALGIVDADVSASAAIVDTKLAQIATASKVSGAALTSLSSIPSAAGVIPAVNLPGVNHVIQSTLFETSGRFVSQVSGSGANAFNTTGGNFFTGATANSHAYIAWQVSGGAGQLFNKSPKVSFQIEAETIDTANGTGSMFCGIGDVNVDQASPPYTEAHIGFKAVKTGGSTILYATQANGTTETASSALLTVGAGESFDLFFIVNGSTSVDYYYRSHANGTWASVNLTTNMPTLTTNVIYITLSASNNATAFTFNWIAQSAAYMMPL